MNIDVVLRTHNTSNVHTDRERYINISKTQLILGCLSSLVKSSSLIVGHNINFIILDDNSTEDLFPQIDDIFNQYSLTYELVHLPEKGYKYSALKQFQYCRDSKADLVYSVEDDYLHCPSAISEMIDNYQLFTEKTGKEICIYPFDMPDDYIPPWMEQCMVVHGTKRHWRTGIWTTNTMMCSPKVFQDHWTTFETLAKGYDSTKHEIHEGNTICNIWRNHVIRFSPIPSLALHMQFDTQIDPYIDWKYWWEKFT